MTAIDIPADAETPVTPIAGAESLAGHPPRPGMFRSLRVRNYRLWSAGQLVSQTGTWMQRVAQDWLVLQLTNSGTALGVVTALQFGQSFLFSPWAGTLADRLDKRKLVFATQSAMGLLALILGILDLTHVVTYWQVLVLAGALGTVTAIDSPVRQSFVVEMVGKDDLTNAVAINGTIFNFARVLGPAIAGFAIVAVGTGWSFVANAFSSAAVLAGLYFMRTNELYPSPPVARARGQVREGIRYVRGRPDLVTTLTLLFFIGTFGLNFQITTALLTKQVFHRAASGYGALSSALAIGACAGAIMATRRTRRPSVPFLLVVAAIFGVCETVCGLMPSFALTAVMLVPTGFAMLSLTTASNAFVQLGVDPTMRGRVMSLYVMAFLGGTPIGAPITGWLAETAGPRWGVVSGGLISILAVLVLGVATRRAASPTRTRAVPRTVRRSAQ